MKKISKVLFVLVLAIVSAASAMDDLWLSCGTINIDNNAVFDCYIDQGSEPKSHGTEYSTKDYSSWNDLVAAYAQEIVGAMNFSKHLNLGTDIVFDEHNSECTSDYSSIKLSYSTFDGKDKTIKNFCKKGVKAAFFEGESGDTIQNVTFENAYLEAVSNGDPGKVGVVVDSLVNSVIRNVKVKTSSLKISVTDAELTSSFAVGALVGLGDGLTLDSNQVENVTISGAKGQEGDANAYYVGGLVGNVSLNWSSHFAKGNSVTAQISLPFSRPVYVGGLFGIANGAYENKIMGNVVRAKMSTSATSADSDTLISLTATSMGNAYVGGLIGFVSCSLREKAPAITNNSVYGMVSVNATSFTGGTSIQDSSAIGGIVGQAQTDESGLVINSNASYGGVLVKAKTGADEWRYKGYVVGKVYADKTNATVMGNNHYSLEDQNIKKALGWFALENNDISDESGYDALKFNYRNAIYKDGVAVLKETGDGKTFVYGGIVANGTMYYNPIITEEFMKSREFTYEQNEHGTHKEYFWENDSTNGGFPYLTNHRSAYKILLVVYDEDASSDLQNLLKNKFVTPSKNMEPFLMKDSSDEKLYYYDFTDQNGRISENFMSAYTKNFQNKFALQYGGGDVARGAVLNPTKVYGPNPVYGAGEYVYYLKEKFLMNVVYEGLPASDSLVYVPAKVTSLDKYDPNKVAPRVYDRNVKYTEYLPSQAYITCVDNSGATQKSGNVYLYNLHWNFADVLFGEDLGFNEEDCESVPKVNLVYSNAVEGKIPQRNVVVEKNEAELLVKTAMYGRDSQGKLVAVSDTSGSVYSNANKVIASEMEFFYKNPGYAVDSMSVDFWAYNASSELSFEEMKNVEEHDCCDVNAVSNDFGLVDELVQLLKDESIVRWTISLDKSNRIYLDSLLVAVSQLDLSDYQFYASPRISVTPLRYEITFMLPEEETFYSRGEFEKTVEFSKEEYSSVPQYIYSNDYCVAGWTTTELDAGELAPDWEKVLTEYDAEKFESLLDTGKSNMYPILLSAEYCSSEKDLPEGMEHAGFEPEYARVVLDGADGGIVRIVEYENKMEAQPIWAPPSASALPYAYAPPVSGGDSVVHEFGKSKSMLMLPYNEEAVRVLQFEAKDGFEAPDFLELSFDEKRGGDASVKAKKYANGDTIQTSVPLFGAVLKGDFKLIDTVALAFTDSVMAQSGSVVKIPLATTEFAAGRDAVIRIFVTDNLGVVDTVKSIAVEKTPMDSTAVLNLVPGDHIIKVEMRNIFDSAVSFLDTVSVMSEIAAGRDRWEMVSLAAVDMESVGKDDDQLFYRWDDEAEVGEFWHYLRFLPGEDVDDANGYWYSSLEGRSLKFASSFVDSVYDSKLHLVNVYSGWNMVSNPHSWNVEMPSGLDEVWMWDAEVADYVDNRGYLKPFEAVWVRVEENKTVTLKGEPFFATDSLEQAVASKKRALAKAKNEETWTIRAVLADGRGHMDSWNVLGMGDPSEGYEPPSGMGDLVSLAVKDGKKYLAKSVKAAPASSADSAALEWNLEMSASSGRKGKLYFEGLDEIAAFGYHLYVTVDGRTSELTAGDTLAVALKAASTIANVQVTKEKRYFKTAVEGLRMAQAGNSLNVGFNVTENLDGARLVVDILDMDGKVVSTYSARAASGSNAVSLDAPKSGLYMLRVRVASQQAAGKILVK